MNLIIDLIILFKTESSGEETSVICICLYIGYASSLSCKAKNKELLDQWRVGIVIGEGFVKLT